MSDKDGYRLCGEDWCDLDSCPDEPCHCPCGLEQLQDKAEMRAELSRDKEQGL
jgi:hypothetical protein